MAKFVDGYHLYHVVFMVTKNKMCRDYPFFVHGFNPTSAIVDAVSDIYNDEDGIEKVAFKSLRIATDSECEEFFLDLEEFNKRNDESYGDDDHV